MSSCIVQEILKYQKCAIPYPHIFLKKRDNSSIVNDSLDWVESKFSALGEYLLLDNLKWNIEIVWYISLQCPRFIW